MDETPTLNTLAEGLKTADPDRFMALMAAPHDMRVRFLPLLSFGLEIGRAAWVSNEHLICEMRLQWWQDAIDDIAAGKTPDTHVLLPPLANVIRDHALDPAWFSDMIAARRWDIYQEPFKDKAAFDRHMDHLTGHLMWMQARTLGASTSSESQIRQFAYGAGVAAWLRAVPALEAQKRIPLLDGRSEGVQGLAKTALDGMPSLRAIPKPLRPAVFGGWEARSILKQAIKSPHCVQAGALGQSPFLKKWGLLRATF